MIFINGITILLIYELIGEVAAQLLPIALPGPVIGMFLLFLTLSLRRPSMAAIEMASTTLLSHLSLLFVPAGVGIIVHFNRLTHEWLPITITLLLSTMITMATTAIVMVGIQRFQNKWGHHHA
ncbi:CidA/LrgA family protein [filamentous cyanobacterium LEGE 11480]|uniref:CidA/LrgA family protein n=2 Tax=Romeriopsis TaxID=2992131 RepID=A0A928VJY7_9CYAN|nr:CidA/LrgA family protein [Romeriopsis navalis LEGE 11480]